MIQTSILPKKTGAKWRFVLQRSKNKQYFFSLYAKNNKIVMTSETYKTKAGALKGIDAVGNAFFLHRFLDIDDKTKAQR